DLSEAARADWESIFRQVQGVVASIRTMPFLIWLDDLEVSYMTGEDYMWATADWLDPQASMLATAAAEQHMPSKEYNYRVAMEGFRFVGPTRAEAEAALPPQGQSPSTTFQARRFDEELQAYLEDHRVCNSSTCRTTPSAAGHKVGTLLRQHRGRNCSKARPRPSKLALHEAAEEICPEDNSTQAKQPVALLDLVEVALRQ
ncbi:unnamed protein product, partial [Symbiodinium sp. CCMP2592]